MRTFTGDLDWLRYISLFVVYRRRNQTVKGCCYESDCLGLAIQTNYVHAHYVARAQVSVYKTRLC